MLKMTLSIFCVIWKASTLIFASLKHCNIIFNFFIIVNFWFLYLISLFKMQNALSMIIHKFIIINELGILTSDITFKHSSSLTCWIVMWVFNQHELIDYWLTMLNSFKLKLLVCICTHSALIKSEKNCCSEGLLLLHLWVVITYSFDFFLEDVEVNDLIMNKKKIKKEEGKEMNILSHVKFQDAHCLFEHKTQAETVKASFWNFNFKGKNKVLVIIS